jgi:hypothetical protein
MEKPNSHWLAHMLKGVVAIVISRRNPTGKSGRNLQACPFNAPIAIPTSTISSLKTMVRQIVHSATIMMHSNRHQSSTTIPQGFLWTGNIRMLPASNAINLFKIKV